jgi:hypothetical protein
MRSLFSLFCILESAIFISLPASGIAVSTEPLIFLTTSIEAQEYASNIAKTIHNTVNAILRVPSDQQTFENILQPWNQLFAQLPQDFEALGTFGKRDPSSHIIVSQTLDDLHAYWLEVTQDPELCQALINCSLGIDYDTTLDPFQRYMATRCIKKNANAPVYLLGFAEEKNSPAIDVTVLNLASGSFLDNIPDLANQVLSESVDAVCIREVVSDDHAHHLYKALQWNYAHFIYFPPTVGLSPPMSYRNSGTVIASKRGHAYFNFKDNGSDTHRSLLLPLSAFSQLHTFVSKRQESGGGSAEVVITYEWGGKDGSELSVSIKGEAHDSYGNYVEATASQNSDGEGKAEVKGGYEK